MLPPSTAGVTGGRHGGGDADLALTADLLDPGAAQEATDRCAPASREIDGMVVLLQRSAVTPQVLDSAAMGPAAPLDGADTTRPPAAFSSAIAVA